MRSSILNPASFLLIFIAGPASALPIGFGHTQGNLDYFETKNEHFIVYHDKETPNEARSALNSLSVAKPILESWMQVKRSTPMPVVMTSIASGASFANFITDAIELQTQGRGDRDLYWHELTHSTMYRHLDNWLGPAGAVLHLPWMPSWFIEGLPEALAISIGSDVQAAYERYHALSGNWPSFERLHSLYGGQSFATQGYATSGGFVAYIFRTYGADKLPKLLRTFYKNSMPWWWPWALVPFGPFLPMDDALEEMTGKDGRQLYEEYKSAATAYWQEHSQGSFLYERVGSRQEWSPSVGMWQSGNRVHYLQTSGGKTQIRELSFADNKGWALSADYADFPESDTIVYAKASGGHIVVEFSGYTGARITRRNLVFIDKDQRSRTLASVAGEVTHLAVSTKRIIWVEENKEVTRVCHLDRNALTGRGKFKSKCVAKIVQPSLFTFLGTQFVNGDSSEPIAKEIWFAKHDQKMVGDVHTLYRWDIDSNEPPKPKMVSGYGKPRAVAFAGEDIWLSVAERTHHTLRRIDRELNCKGVVPFADLVLNVWGFSDGSVATRIRAGQKDSVIRLSAEELPTKSCYPAKEHISPLLVATRSGKNIPIDVAVKNSNLWAQNLTAADSYSDTEIVAAPTIDRTSPTPGDAQPAKSRFRPVFAVPWMQADALGYNFGVLSIPLMDHMQNETLTLTALFGLVGEDAESGANIGRFPSTELSLVSTRFWPTLKLDAFRNQAFDGVVDGRISYADERGMRLTSYFYNAWTDSSFELGIQSSHLRPYLGRLAREGQHNMPFASFSKSKAIGSVNVSFSAEGKVVPKEMNTHFDYNQLDLSLSAARSFSFLSSRFSLGFSTGRTRGPQTRNLQELYQPLRTFIPGSGGGLNSMKFDLDQLTLCTKGKTVRGEQSLIDCPTSVFASQYGENQMRLSANYTFPIIPNFEKLIRMFYLKSLEFGSFVNYGGAWSDYVTPKTGPDGDLVGAVGANTDLLFELNGVKFNVGLGSGKVLVPSGKVSFFIKIGFDSVLQVNQN